MFETMRLPLLLIGLASCSAAAADDLVGKMGDAELHSSELKVILDAQPPDARRQLATEPAALERLVRQDGMAAIIVEQHAHKVLGMTDRAIILERGRIALAADSAALLRDAAALERHLGVGGR